MRNALVYTTTTGNPNHADMVSLIHSASCAPCAIARYKGDTSGDCSDRPVAQEPACRSTTPEPHLSGEFPMSCYACHMVADA